MNYIINMGRHTFRIINDFENSPVISVKDFRIAVYFTITPEIRGDLKKVALIYNDLRKYVNYNGALDTLSRFGIKHYQILASELRDMTVAASAAIKEKQIEFGTPGIPTAPSYYVAEFIFDDDKGKIMPII